MAENNYDLEYTGSMVDRILDTGYDLQNQGYIFRGLASHYTGTPTERTWLIAPTGSTGFGLSSPVPPGSIGICMYNGSSWSAEVLNTLTLDTAPTAGSGNGITSAAVKTLAESITNAIGQLEQSVSDRFTSLTLEDTTGSLQTELLSITLKYVFNGETESITSISILAATAEKAGLMSAADKQKLDAFVTNIRSLRIQDTTAQEDQDTEITNTLKWTIGGVTEAITAFTLYAATTSKAGLMSAADKQKLDAFITNIRSLRIQDTTAQDDQGSEITNTLRWTIGGVTEAITAFTLYAATTSKAGLMSAADKTALDTLPSLINAGYLYAGIATPSTVPSSTSAKIFYLAIEGGTYTGFNLNVTQGINIIYKSGDAWSVAQVVGIDNEPTAGSDNLVKSGGVKTELALGAVYDVSAHNNGATFESLSELLSDTDLNALIPTAVRKGGMSIKFVQSSDNKYVQYRLVSSIWSTDIHDWTSEDPYFIDKIMQEVNEAIDEHTPIEITGDVTNAPDEEDLTSVNVGGTDVLKFKDKAYNPLTYNGMGRKILRKNIVDGVNTLTQEMISDANTIYVIQYDFTLGEDITVPENCVLEFDGGSLNNGTITLNSTLLLPNPFDINKFMPTVIVQGTQKTITSAEGFTGIREDKFEKGQLVVEPGFDNWQKKVYFFDGYQLVSIPTLPKIGTSPSGRENTLNLCCNWVNYKKNNPTAKVFEYGGDNTCFRKNFDENNTWQINCSTFSLVISLGIPFEKSRYYLGASAQNQFDGNHYPNNELMNWFMDSAYTSSRDLAVYLYNQGFCFTPNEDFSNIDTGDILFFNFAGGNGREGIDFLGIDHSGIFGYRFGDRFVTFEVGSGAPEQMLRAVGSMRSVVLCARLPKKNYEINYNNLIYNGNEPKTVTVNNQLIPVNIYEAVEILKAGTSYTAIVDCTIPNGVWPSIVKVAINTQGKFVIDKYLANFTNVRSYKPNDNKYYITFTVPEDTRFIGVYANSTVSANVSLRSTTILKGVITDISKIKLPYFPKKLSIIASDGITISDFRVSYSGDIIIIAGTFKGLSLNNDSFITAFTITPLYFIQTTSFGYGTTNKDNIAKLVQCQVTRSSNYGILRFACNDVVESDEPIIFSISIPSR